MGRKLLNGSYYFIIGYILGLNRDNGKYNGNCYIIIGYIKVIIRWGRIRSLQGLKPAMGKALLDVVLSSFRVCLGVRV